MHLFPIFHLYTKVKMFLIPLQLERNAGHFIFNMECVLAAQDQEWEEMLYLYEDHVLDNMNIDHDHDKENDKMSYPSWHDKKKDECTKKSLPSCDEFGMTVLHWVCTDILVDVHVLETVCNPTWCRVRNASDMLPLHVALQHRLPAKHIDILCSMVPQSVLEVVRGESIVAFARSHNVAVHTLQLLQEKINMEAVPKRLTISKHSMERKISSCSSGSVEGQIQDLVMELQSLRSSMRMSPRHSCASTLSTSSSIASDLNEMIHTSVKTKSPMLSIAWKTSLKLGLSFEAHRSGYGARLKRFTSKCETKGVEDLHLGDRIQMLNDTDVSKLPFDTIVNLLKKAKGTLHMSFSRASDKDRSNVHELLDDISRRTVHLAETSLRESNSLRMSYVA